MAKIKTCVIHMGTAKTGSTSIQNVMSQNRAFLRKYQRLIYPKFGDVNWHYSLAYYAKGQDWIEAPRYPIKTLAEKKQWSQEFEQFIDVLITRNPKDCTYLFSSEHLHQRLNKREYIERVHALLSPYFKRFKILVFLKPQSALAVSLYNTRLKGGKTVLDFFPQPNQAVYYYDYFEMLGHWAAVFGSDALTIRVLDDNPCSVKDVMDEFCLIMGLDKHHLKNAQKKQNVSFDALGLDLFYMLNRYMDQYNLTQGEPVRQALEKYLNHMQRTIKKLPSRAEAQAFDHRFEESNRRLAETFGLGAQPFQIDYLKYPETATPFTPAVDLLGFIDVIQNDVNAQMAAWGQHPFDFQALKAHIYQNPYP